MTLTQLTKALTLVLGQEPKPSTCDITIKGLPHVMVTCPGVGTGIGRVESEAFRSMLENVLVENKDKMESLRSELDCLEKQAKVIQISLMKSRQAAELLTTLLEVDL